MTSKKKLRVLVAKNSAGNITAIGVPNPKFANKIGLHPPDGGTVQTIDVPAKSKLDSAPLEPRMVEELLKTGRLPNGPHKRQRSHE